MPAPLLSAVALLASVEPTWTDKEMLIAVGSTIVAAIPVVLFLVRWIAGGLRRRLREAENELRTLRRTLDSRPPTPNQDEARADLERRLAEARQEAERLRAEAAEASEKAAAQARAAEQLQGHLAEIGGAMEQQQAERDAAQRRVERALRKDGQTWNEKVLASAPDFRGLEPDGRKTPIISVLNLKGGVGKTTVTANLAAALDARGYRVLVLDLDLQGSLTGLFIDDACQDARGREGLLLQDFLTASLGAEFPNLLDYTLPILPSGKSGLVPTSDDLAYAEMNLTLRWLLRDSTRDVRFLLRRELQLKRITGAYDLILLDCPPLFNVTCVNALAASDYLLVPIVPSVQATARVPVLLRRLRDLRGNINPDLKVMGVVTNRTSRSELTGDELRRLSLLRAQCLDIWGAEVPQFETFIRQSVEIRAGEDERRPLAEGESMRAVFAELADEVESRLPMFCRASAARQPKGVLS